MFKEQGLHDTDIKKHSVIKCGGHINSVWCTLCVTEKLVLNWFEFNSAKNYLFSPTESFSGTCAHVHAHTRA